MTVPRVVTPVDSQQTAKNRAGEGRVTPIFGARGRVMEFAAHQRDSDAFITSRLERRVTGDRYVFLSADVAALLTG